MVSSPQFPHWAKNKSYTKLAGNLSCQSLAVCQGYSNRPNQTAHVLAPCRCVVPLWVWLFVDLSIACTFFSIIKNEPIWVKKWTIPSGWTIGSMEGDGRSGDFGSPRLNKRKHTNFRSQMSHVRKPSCYNWLVKKGSFYISLFYYIIPVRLGWYHPKKTANDVFGPLFTAQITSSRAKNLGKGTPAGQHENTDICL